MTVIVALEKTEEFLLESGGSVMFLLIFNVVNCSLKLRHADAEGAIAFLPCK